MNFTKRLLLVVILFSVTGVNILNKKYTDYTLYFAIPFIILTAFLILKVVKESDTINRKHRINRTKAFIAIALIINIILGYIIFNFK